jgi:hypothetical protein
MERGRGRKRRGIGIRIGRRRGIRTGSGGIKRRGRRIRWQKDKV